MSGGNTANQERLEKLKHEHFKDLMANESNIKGPQYDQARRILSETGQAVTRPIGGNQSDAKLPPKPNPEKIYGNLNDIVSYEERMLLDQMRAGSPFGSQMNSRIQQRPNASSQDRRMKGLESIYMQKFEKKITGGIKKAQPKAKFRNTINRFVDDPELLVDDGTDLYRQNQVSMMVADKLDRLQKQYMSNTATNRFAQVSNQIGSSMGFQAQPANLTGGPRTLTADSKQPFRKNGSVSNSVFNQDPSLEPVKKGNWVQRD